MTGRMGVWVGELAFVYKYRRLATDTLLLFRLRGLVSVWLGQLKIDWKTKTDGFTYG